MNNTLSLVELGESAAETYLINVKVNTTQAVPIENQ